MENNGYGEGLLHSIIAKAPKSSRDLLIKNQSKTFCHQLKEMSEEVKDLALDVENFDNSKKQFDHRLSYIESVCKNIVTQTEYRNDMIKYEEQILAKVAKAIDSIQEELGQNKEYVDTKASEFQDKVNESEMKTVCKIQDCEDLLKQRVSEQYLENILKTRDDKMNK